MPLAPTDALYAAFCARLPDALHAVGRELPHRLKLAPRPGVPWSLVFKHELTLAAPAVLAAGTSGLDANMVEPAVLAHMLAVIEAFGSDRVADRQVAADPDLIAVLRALRAARDRAFHALGGPPAVARVQQATRTTLAAIARERTLLAGGSRLESGCYRSVSADKQSIGLAASLAFGAASGLPAPRIELIAELLLGVCLGLQHQDDVLDWEDDARHGGAWAIALAGGQQATRDAMLASGTLGQMLGFAVEEYERAQRAAEQLGSSALSVWLEARTVEARELRDQETRYPGYARRRMKLAPWVMEVLADRS
jgi:hypothetical protein